jgi:hypothetical protein
MKSPTAHLCKPSSLSSATIAAEPTITNLAMFCDSKQTLPHLSFRTRFFAE